MTKYQCPTCKQKYNSLNTKLVEPPLCSHKGSAVHKPTQMKEVKS